MPDMNHGYIRDAEVVCSNLWKLAENLISHLQNLCVMDQLIPWLRGRELLLVSNNVEVALIEFTRITLPPAIDLANFVASNVFDVSL